MTDNENPLIETRFAPIPNFGGLSWQSMTNTTSLLEAITYWYATFATFDKTSCRSMFNLPCSFCCRQRKFCSYSSCKTIKNDVVMSIDLNNNID